MNFIAADYNFYGFVGEVYVNGQFQDVWCNSDVVITDNNMYASRRPLPQFNSPSCYKSFYTSIGLQDDTLACVHHASHNYHTYFLCM